MMSKTIATLEWAAHVNKAARHTSKNHEAETALNSMLKISEFS